MGPKRPPGGVVAYWLIDNARAALQRLLEMGAHEHEEAQDFDEGHIGTNPHRLDVLSMSYPQP